MNNHELTDLITRIRFHRVQINSRNSRLRIARDQVPGGHAFTFLKRTVARMLEFADQIAVQRINADRRFLRQIGEVNAASAVGGGRGVVNTFVTGFEISAVNSIRIREDE